MILLIHLNGKLISCFDDQSKEYMVCNSSIMAVAMPEVASSKPQRWLVWCDVKYKEHLDLGKIRSTCRHSRIMISNNMGDSQYLSSNIGYVEESPFIKVPENIKFPTWQMTGIAGAIFSDTFLTIDQNFKSTKSFDLMLNSIAKAGQSMGLLCYQIPIVNTAVHQNAKANSWQLFKFVGRHYKKRWLPFLFFCEMRYKRNFPILQMFAGFIGDLVTTTNNLDQIPCQKGNPVTMDVLIPTMGRAGYLEQVLQDLSKQTLLPKQIIIIEQDPTGIWTSELSNMLEQDWPFTITHRLINETGACNARNIGLQLTQSKWVFLADDDIRIDSDILKMATDFMATYSCNAFTVSCLQKGEIELKKTPFQWNGFGSGCSFVKSAAVQETIFDTALEHGYGEDADFGMQLRKKGIDVLYAPHIRLKHLKAPIGGFRKVIQQPWEIDRPKPSPTVMLSILKHWSVEQIAGYKLKMLFKFYARQQLKNPFAYFKDFNRRWEKSNYWAQYLKNKNR